MPPRRRFRLESVPPPDRQELLPVELNGRNYDLVFDPRCHVCRLGPDGVHLVNSLLAQGFTYQNISKQVSNVTFNHETRKVSVPQIRQHFEKHVPVKTAAVRTILEHRAAKMQQDFIEGTESLVNPYVYAEALMQKAFSDLMDSPSPVSARDGMEAAKLLHQFNKEEAAGTDMAEALSQLNKIITAVREVVPPAMFSQIIDKIQGNQIPSTVDAEVMDDDPIDDIDEQEEAEYGPDEPETNNEVS